MVLSAIMVSCGNNKGSTEGTPAKKDVLRPGSATQPSTTHADITKRDTLDAGESDTTIGIQSGEAFIKGHLTANKGKPKYTVLANTGQTVTATVKPLKKGGNVRINQVQQPNGAFDGPFGDSLTYTFKRSGKLIFIIGENLMAGDPYTGDFLLHVKLTTR